MPALKGTVPWNKGKGQGWIDPRGYRVFSTTINGKRSQVKEHRHIMAEQLGRRLEPWELVHHKDGNPLNNAPDNLELMTFGEHTTEHRQGTKRSYETRQTIEAFANMRYELQRTRALNADLLAALRPLVAIVNGANVPSAKREQYLDEARAAIAKATNA